MKNKTILGGRKIALIHIPKEINIIFDLFPDLFASKIFFLTIQVSSAIQENVGGMQFGPIGPSD